MTSPVSWGSLIRLWTEKKCSLVCSLTTSIIIIDFAQVYLQDSIPDHTINHKKLSLKNSATPPYAASWQYNEPIHKSGQRYPRSPNRLQVFLEAHFQLILQPVTALVITLNLFDDGLHFLHLPLPLFLSHLALLLE